MKKIKFISVVLFLVNSNYLKAQDVGEFFSMSPAELANIPVTIATGTAKPAHLSASVTTVITAQQIDTMGATKLSQVLETVPGLHVAIQAVTYDPVYSMRGMQNGVNSQVLVLLNGTRFSTPYKGSAMQGMEIPVEAIQKIEVIRGPGSALYGADAFAGVINIVTKKAKDIEGTVIGVRAGAWDTQSIWGQHSEQLLGWDIAANLQYSHNNNDGDRMITSDLQTQFDNGFGTSASIAPNEMETKAERWNAHLNLQRQHWEIGFWTYNEVDIGTRAGAGGALDNEGTINGEHYLTDLKYSSEDLVKDWEFLVHASYLFTNVDSKIHIFPKGSLLPIDNKGEINPTVPFVFTPTFFPEGIISHLEIENQVYAYDVSSIFKGVSGHTLRLTTGFRYEQTRTKESRNAGKGVITGSEQSVDGSLTNVTGTDFVFLPNSRRTIWSAALQDEWAFSQDWLLTAGIRYDKYSDFGSTFNPRVALVWGVSEQLSAKIMYGRAFRAPTFLEQKQQNNPFFVGNPDLEPEVIETIELAFDYIPHHNLRLASNFYFYKIEDLIATAEFDGNISSADNAEGQTGVGAEIEWNWDIYDQWNLKGNYAWQYARNETTKKRVTGVPEHQVYAALSWQFLPKWQLQAQLNWVGHRVNFEGSAANLKLEDYETIDITLNSRRFYGYVDFTTSVRNLFNTEGKEPAIAAFPENLPIASRSFYFETTLHF